ncbi:MAG TPA: DUF4270 domain-containing protein [Bacteroidia bacterium]|nr:DUF4270 domain-containing protein [Bacteroidia bacterium]HNP98458.1 DUF4270 domain-containing protein [Bacteroidia bacterium]
MKINFAAGQAFRIFRKTTNNPKQNFNTISSTLSWRKYFFLVSIIAGIALVPACKDPEEIGLGIIPGSDTLGLSLSDTSTIYTRTVLEDTLRTDELSVELLGSVYDPVFGKHQAAIYAHTVLAGVPNFNGVTHADSLVLTLFYSGAYGDTSLTQTVNVYRMTEDMEFDSVYYSNKNFSYDAVPLGTQNFKAWPNHTVVVGGDTQSAQLRIPLSLALADSIMALSGGTELSTSDNWNAYFKGLYIKTDEATVSGTGCIAYFNFLTSKMTLYYHGTDTVARTYSFTLAGARVNSFSHDYTGTDIAAQIADSNAVDSLAYLQSMAGVKTKISFPFLKHFTDSGSIVVNKAELTITAQAGTPLDYPVPSRILVVALDSVGGTYFPIDYYETGGYFGGSINADGRTYTFNLTRHIQRILDGQVSNDGLYAVVFGSAVQANRLIMGSGKNADYRMKLKLYYTHLP